MKENKRAVRGLTPADIARADAIRDQQHRDEKSRHDKHRASRGASFGFEMCCDSEREQ